MLWVLTLLTAFQNESSAPLAADSLQVSTLSWKSFALQGSLKTWWTKKNLSRSDGLGGQWRLWAEETLKSEFSRFCSELHTALCCPQIQTHWAAWRLIEPQTVGPKRENQLIQIKDSQTGNGIVQSTPEPAGYFEWSGSLLESQTCSRETDTKRAGVGSIAPWEDFDIISHEWHNNCLFVFC